VWSACVALIVAAITVAYCNSLRVGFQFDDFGIIAENDEIRRLWPLVDVLSPRTLGVAGRPLVNVSLAVNYAIGGLDVVGYHIGNIAIHVLCAVLFFSIVRLTLRGSTSSPRPEPAEGRGLQFEPSLQTNATGLGLAFALVWGLHPLQTGSVTYISARSESLMGLWYFLMIYAGIRALGSTRPAPWNAVAVASCALGMATKESMVTAPVAMVLYDCAFIFPSLNAAVSARWRLYAGLATTWVVLAVLQRQSPNTASIGFTTDVSAWTYLLNQTVIVTEYLRAALWPQGLVFAYGEPRYLTIADVAPYAGLVTALVGATLWTWLVQPKIGFSALWFFVTLAPTSSVVPIATEVGAERRMYLPLAGLVILAVGGGYTLREWLRSTTLKSLSDRNVTRAYWTVVVLLCAALTAITVRRNAEYSSSVMLWQTTLNRWPSSVAHRNLATALKMVGKHDEALDHLRQTVGEHPEARYILGVDLLELGRFDEGIRELRNFIHSTPADPNVVTAHLLVGRALAARGMASDAAEEFAGVLKIQPANASAQIGLADALLAQERFQEAVPAYRRYLAGQPDAAGALTNLGIALIATGDVDGALDVFRRAVELEPQNAAARENLANALTDRRQAEHGASRAAR
jgi:tetratricopeptide (TPR) repeat protein